MTTKAPPAPSAPAIQSLGSLPKCSVEKSEGKLVVRFVIDDPATIGRYERRVEGTRVSLAEYLWENVIKRAVDGGVW